ncbi:MAG: hypothetical protein EOP62_13840 [Sphingomonadales bacterium]|nr:MAG: hypothetical protein EOP62_13840 [Sphingomonadales bacterium]
MRRREKCVIKETLKPDALAIPEDIDDITLEWLQSSLKSRDIDDELRSFSVAPIGEGFGQTGIAALIRLDYANTAKSSANRPETLVIKMATPDPTRRAVARSMNLYDREVRFYQTLAEDVRVRVPRCFFAQISEDGLAYALLLEGFADHRPGDETIGCSIEDARIAVPELARLHAPNWDSALAKSMSSFPAIDQAKYEQAWDRMIADFGHLVPEEIQSAKARYIERIPSLVRWIGSDPITVIHADYKLDNLLFGPPGSPDPIVVLDWQGMRPGKPIQDFAYLIGQNMNSELRRAQEVGLLKLYLEALEKEGITYDFSTAYSDYRKATLYLWSYVIAITGLMVNNHERAIRRKSGLIQRAASAVMDLDTLSLLDQFSAT